MTRDEDKVWSLYGSDAGQALHEIEQSLLALESDPSSAEEINGLYRALHTLKGNSALLELKRIETLAHVAEDVIGVVREGRARIDQPTVDLMLAAVDVLRASVAHVERTRTDVDEATIQPKLVELRAWLSARGEVEREHVSPRGGVMLFSDKPARASMSASVPTPVDGDSLGMFLRLAKNLLLPEGTLLQSEESLGALVDVLLPGAQRLGYDALARALSELAPRVGGRAELARGALAPLLRALAEVEAAYRALCERPEDFGFARLASAAEAASSATVQSLIADSKPAPAMNLPPLEVRVSRAPKAKHTPAVAPPARPPHAEQPRTQVLRVDASRVSFVMDLAGEIGLACSAVTHHPELAGRELEGFSAAAHKLEMLVRELQNEVSALRLVPINTVFQLMQRVVRDTARRTQKQVQLVIAGEDTEIDKVAVDALHDPLVHLLRNAIDHGIESPAERVAAGKPAAGRIVLEASHQGGEVQVEVRDDGRGLNRKKILHRARERGLITSDATLADAQILELIFLPGFSTKDQIDELSGRGVGMDVIRTSVEALRGRVRLSSVEGKGSSVKLTVPLTMAFLDAMVVRDQGLLYAIPIEKVCEVFKTQAHQVCSSPADGRVMLRVRDQLVPLLRLREFYGQADTLTTRELLETIVVVVQTAEGQLALPVDALLGNQPVMLKPMRGVISRVRAAAGCGMLRSGDVALTLDCERLHA
ncbi:MAG TPA: chemotaxis protein CheA [Polyangiales bacterium]